ncbi:response regulator transcription factor [Arachidicoccus ginsenosidivorans]|uniref:Response regulator transcription factor n=2 Tax=Arachidicoccus ginsenosidivorans TaxID=496057 RepID=A0A5B8VIS0_9BACT|nr:response regulator transcription factor [Arachidicoccus ginsenosidivorans]
MVSWISAIPVWLKSALLSPTKLKIMKSKILILEDETIIAHGIKMHLDNNGYDTDIALNPTDAITLVRSENYTALICDINLKDKISGITFVKEYVDPSIPVVFLTAYNDLQTMKEAELASPFAYVTKPFDKDHLLITLNLAISNCRKKFLHKLPEDINIDKISMSIREIEIIRLLAQSKTSDEISAQLFISPQTVATHRKNILRKTGAKSMIELVSLAIEKGWI